MHHFASVSLRRIVRRLLPPLFAVCLCFSSRAADEAKKTFRVPAGDAGQTLKQFAAQAGREIVFSPEVVGAVKTNAVQGELTPHGALEQMLANTGLVAGQDAKTGAFAVRRGSNDPNAPRAALEKSSDRPEQNGAVKNGADTEMTVLSPFVVNTARDSGYTAASSLAGGRVNTPLLETPAAISVITRQFLDDIAATDPSTVAEWMLNMVPNYVVGKNSFSTYTYNPRNLVGAGTSFPTRNYFLYYGYSDDYNIDRYEIDRGPNGTIYGDSSLGGMTSTWTKRAQFGRARTIVNARADTYGGWRTSLDANMPVTDALALRFNALHDRTQDWHDIAQNHADAVALASTYHVTKNDDLRFDGEVGYYLHQYYTVNNVDSGSYWDGKTSFDGATTPSTTGTGLTRVASNSNLVYLPGAANGGLNDLSTYYTTLGTGVSIWPTARADIANFPVLPRRSFSLQPHDSLSGAHFRTYTFYFEHRFSNNLSAEVAYNRSLIHRNNGKTAGNFFNTYRIDVNTILPGGAPNPNYGKPYSEQAVINQDQENDVSEVHGLVNWRLATSWLKESLSALTGSRLDRMNNNQTRLERTSGPGTKFLSNGNPDLSLAANIVLIRRYWDQAGMPYGDPPSVPGTTLAFVPSSGQHQRKALDYAQVASTSHLFKDRLTVMAGVRYDHIHDVQDNSNGVPVDPATGLPQLGAAIVPPGGGKTVTVVGAKMRTRRDAFSRNIGATYFFVPSFGAYVNYAESIASNIAGAPEIDGTTPGIARNTGQDVGLRLNLFGGKIAGSFSFYHTKQVGGLVNSNLFVSQINEIWTDLGRSDLANVDYRDTQDRNGQGWEFELTANPSPQLRLMWNLALPRSTVVNIQPGLNGYYAQNLARWQAGANDPANPLRTTIQNDLNTIANYLASLTPGTPVNDTYKYQSNLFATYTFAHGVLKNFSVGGGANLRGPDKVDSLAAIGQPYAFVYSRAYAIISANASYRWRVSNKLTARFQLNVSNLLNNKGIILASQDRPATATYRAGGIGTNPLLDVPSGFRVPDPRKAILSTVFEF